MNKKATKKFTVSKEQSPAESIALGAVKSYGISIGLFAVLLFICAAIAMYSKDPDSLCTLLGYASCAVSLLFAGILSARFSRDNFLVCALISGALLALTALIINLIMKNGNGGVSQIFFVIFPIISLLGGFIGVPKGKKTKHKFKNK